MNIQRRANNGGLPNELLSLIFIHLNNKDILRCSLVCRDFRDIIGKDSRLQYPIALAKHGFIDGPHGDRAIGECLRLLLDQRSRWHTFARFGVMKRLWSSAETLTYTDGMLVRRAERTVGHERRDTVFVRYMPNRMDANGFYAHLSVNFPVVAASVDPVRDLLVLVEMRIPDPDSDANTIIRLRLAKATPILAWVPHPEVRRDTLGLEYDCVGKRDCKVSGLRIAGNKLMLNVGDTVFTCLYIWDWTRGEQLVQRTPNGVYFSIDASLPFRLILDQHGLEPGLHFFADMLSSDSFIMTYYLPTYTLEEEPVQEETPCCIKVFSMDQDNDDPVGVVWDLGPGVYHLLTLILPMPISNVTMTPDIIIGPYLPRPNSCTPFSGDPSSRIIVIDLGTEEDSTGNRVAPCMIVQQSTLFAFAEKYAPRAPPGEESDVDEAVRIPWEEWGPQHTRVIETVRNDHCPRAVHAIHGERGVFTILDAAGLRRTCILDFNTRPSILGDDYDTQTHPCRTRLVTGPSTVRSPYFKGPITSHLPYYETFLLGSLGDPKTDYGLDEERLVQVAPRGEDLRSILTVLFV